LNSSLQDNDNQRIVELRFTLQRLNIPEPPSDGGKYLVIKQLLPIKRIMALGMDKKMKWRLGIAWNFRGVIGPLRLCPCNLSPVISQKHTEICGVYDRAWTL
jgi:hypothetical protein